MTQQHQQNHATWECKYHVVFIPKYRKKAIFGVIKKRGSPSNHRKRFSAPTLMLARGMSQASR